MSFLSYVSAAVTGSEAQEPGVKCDHCGAEQRFPSGTVWPTWFRDGRAPRGWQQYLDPRGLKRHRCPRCRIDP